LKGFVSDLISLIRGINKDLITMFHFVEIFCFRDNVIVSGIINEIHTNDIDLMEGSKIENKLFIIFRICFLM